MSESEKKVNWKYTNYVAIGALLLGIVMIGILIAKNPTIIIGAKATKVTTKVTKITPTITVTPTEVIYDNPTNTGSANNNTKVTTVDCIGPDGKHMHVTQQQCDTFNKAWNNTPKNSTGTSQNQSVVACVLSEGTYQMTKDQCTEMQASDHPGQVSNYIPVYFTPVPQATTPTPQQSQQNNNIQYEACVSSAQGQYNGIYQNCLGTLGGSSGANYAICELKAQSAVQQSISQCH